MKTNSLFDSFVGIYKNSKTLRFELKPVGKTLDWMKEHNVLDGDFTRAEEYPKVKKILDEEHKALIDRALVSAQLNWEPLNEALEAFRKDNAFKPQLIQVQEAFRKEVLKLLKADKEFASINNPTPSDFFKHTLSDMSDKDEYYRPLSTFSKFACYFQGFQKNRENLYSVSDIATAVPYRIVNDNFPKFATNVHAFMQLSEKFPSIPASAESELANLLAGCSLAEIFSLNGYNRCLTQHGISFINQIIGGYTLEDGTKIRGLNEFVNLYIQQHPECKSVQVPDRMTLLFKQILSDRDSLSFIPQMFGDDSEVLKSVADFRAMLKDEGILPLIFKGIEAIRDSHSGVYMAADELASVSQKITGSWNTIRNAQSEAVENHIARVKLNKKEQEALWKTLKRDAFSIAELSNLRLLKTDDAGNSTQVSILSYWQPDIYRPLLERVEETEKNVLELLADTEKQTTSLRARKSDVAAVKAYLDAVMDLLHYFRPLRISANFEKNAEVYEPFDRGFDQLELIVPLYSKVRNYLTKKIGETTKMKLMFGYPTLASGWDRNKEAANGTVLFMKDGQYYLGIIASDGKTGKKCKIDFGQCASATGDGPVYSKMVYKYLPGPNKMLPKVIFAKSNQDLFTPGEELVRRYKNGEYKKGKTFSLSFCHQLIDYFKVCISKYPDWKDFNFKFSDTSTYNGIDGFYKEVANQGYKISFSSIPEKVIDGLVENGQLYLFRLHNKDFAPKATGKANLHTLYWKALFSPENLRDVIVKLDGQAELFYRPKVIDEPIVHRVGGMLVNRRAKDGTAVPPRIYREIYEHANHRGELGEEAKKWLPNVTVKPVKHEIKKDRRFTEEKFFLHVPLTLNFKAPDACRDINARIIEAVRDNPDVNIIGLDRGERHLIYMSLINGKGEILKQKSFNLVTGQTYDGKTVTTDYHELLDIREKSRDAARKSWDTIGQIKDLKSGYLSTVIHEIVSLMIQYNAIVVLEDLNFGFKRGRFRIEKQVYQKFEQMLINKLNYLSFKDRDDFSVGGILKGYQLTERFESFQKLGKQSGALFYVPAGYTSKIDPTTGFSNLFQTKKCTNAANDKAFLETFRSITYDAKREAYAFAFSYDDFKTSQTSYRKEWTVYSAKRRLTYRPSEKKEEEIFPTEIITRALLKLGRTDSQLHDGFDLLAVIRDTEATAKTASFFKDIFYALDRTLQMRNSSAATGEDYIESPVENAQGECFDSRKADSTLPENADANGAYHIALKGLWMLKHLSKDDTKLPKIDHPSWFEFMQKRSGMVD